MFQIAQEETGKLQLKDFENSSHLAELVKICFHFLSCCVLAHTTNKDLFGAIGYTASVLWGGMLGVNLLSIKCVYGDFENFLHSFCVLEGDEAKTTVPLHRRKSWLNSFKDCDYRTRESPSSKPFEV